MFKLGLEREPLDADTDLASASTFSRLENAATTKDIYLHALRTEVLVHTELANAQPASVILKLFKLAVRVVQYKDRIRLHLPTSCPVKGLLHRVTEILYLARPPDPLPN